MADSNEQEETLNDINNLEKTTSTIPVEPNYIRNDATTFYKAVIGHLRQYSKAELFARDEVIEQMRTLFENFDKR